MKVIQIKNNEMILAGGNGGFDMRSDSTYILYVQARSINGRYVVYRDKDNNIILDENNIADLIIINSEYKDMRPDIQHIFDYFKKSAIIPIYSTYPSHTNDIKSSGYKVENIGNISSIYTEMIEKGHTPNQASTVALDILVSNTHVIRKPDMVLAERFISIVFILKHIMTLDICKKSYNLSKVLSDLKSQSLQAALNKSGRVEPIDKFINIVNSMLDIVGDTDNKEICFLINHIMLVISKIVSKANFVTSVNAISPVYRKGIVEYIGYDMRDIMYNEITKKCIWVDQEYNSKRIEIQQDPTRTLTVNVQNAVNVSMDILKEVAGIDPTNISHELKYGSYSEYDIDPKNILHSYLTMMTNILDKDIITKEDILQYDIALSAYNRVHYELDMFNCTVYDGTKPIDLSTFMIFIKGRVAELGLYLVEIRDIMSDDDSYKTLINIILSVIKILLMSARSDRSIKFLHKLIVENIEVLNKYMKTISELRYGGEDKTNKLEYLCIQLGKLM